MRLNPPPAPGRRSCPRTLLGPVGAVAGVLILAGLLRLVEVFLYSAFKELHVPEQFKVMGTTTQSRIRC
eukprot:scaffold582482_cov52-Prasinocladus_malaysianus.AAC.1